MYLKIKQKMHLKTGSTIPKTKIRAFYLWLWKIKSVLKSVSQKLQHFSQNDIVETFGLRLWNIKSKKQKEDFGLQKNETTTMTNRIRKILLFSFAGFEKCLATF